MVQLVNIIGDQTVAANRLLTAENGSMALVYIQQQKPIVPAELNLMQELQNSSRRMLTANVARPGFFNRDAFSAVGTALSIPESWAMVNGEVLHISSGATGAVVVPLSAAPGSGTAWDVVFLEMWYAEVSAIGMPDVSSESLFINGGVGNGDNASLINYAIKDPLVTSVAETSRRLQRRWRIRVFNTATAPVGDGIIASGAYTVAPGAMGDSGINNGGSQFSLVSVPTSNPITTNLYRAGLNDITSATTFKDAVGYVYAIPIAIVTHTFGENPPLNVGAGGQVADKRKTASVLGLVTDETPNNLALSGDDIIFRKRDNVTETGRVIGSSTPFRIQSTQLVSLATTGTSPFVVTSTTKVVNLNANFLDIAGNPTAGGNNAGNIPVSNGTPNTNLNADMVDGAHVGTGAGNLIVLDTGGTYNGKINPNYIPTAAPLTTVQYLSEARAGGVYTGTGPGNSHPANDFLLKTELTLVGAASSGINAVYRSQYADSSGRATSAGAADTVQMTGVIGAANSIGISANSGNIGNTIVMRRNDGSFDAGTINANITGTAHNADTLSKPGGNPEPLNFSTSYVIALAGPDQLTATASSAWVEPNNKGGASMPPGVYSFPFKPSRLHTQGASIPTKARLYGIVYRVNPGAADYGVLLTAQNGVVLYSYTQTLSGQGASFNLQDYTGGTFNIDNGGSWDGMCTIRIWSTDPAGTPNAFGIGRIYLEVYTIGPNAYLGT
jgi:hypothetical protein